MGFFDFEVRAMGSKPANRNYVKLCRSTNGCIISLSDRESYLGTMYGKVVHDYKTHARPPRPPPQLLYLFLLRV